MALKSAKNIRSALTLNKILGIAKDISYILAIHCDHIMEQVAKSSYKKLLLCEHVNGKQRIAACLLSAATFDLLASCSCSWEDVETKCPYTCKDISPFIIPPSFLEVVNVAMKHKLQIHIRPRFRNKWALLRENGATFLCFQKNIFHEFHLIKRIGFC